RPLARRKVGTEHHRRAHAVVVNLEPERRTAMPVPGFDRIDTVPVRALATRQQEIDRGRAGAAGVIGADVAEGLAVMPALGMRLKREQSDDVGGGVGHGRSHFNTSAAGRAHARQYRTGSDWSRSAPPDKAAFR